MKKPLLTIYFLCVLLPHGMNAGDCAEVSVSTNISNSMIFIDNEYIGDHKISVNLETGEYNLLIVERNRGWDAQKFHERIFVKSCDDSLYFSYEFKEKVFIDSNPQNSSIIFNDSSIAHTPGFIPVSLGSISLVKPGYNKLEIMLEDKPQDNTYNLQFEGDHKPGQFVDSPWFTALIGSAIIFGASAAYFKIEADHKFDEYNRTRNHSVLSDVDRYDLYSGVAFGALQLNFAYLIYKFIFDSP
jgi:hypothetical protein